MKKIILLFVLIIGLTQANAQEISNLCAGATKTLTAAGAGGVAPYTYTWTSPSAVVTTASTVVTSTAGVYTWQATDANGCTASGTHTVNIEADPTASITINAANICVGTSQTITATGVPAGYTYSWNFGANSTPTTSTTASTNVIYSATGSKTITMTIDKIQSGATAGGCNVTCSWVKTKIITVNAITGSSTCN